MYIYRVHTLYIAIYTQRVGSAENQRCASSALQFRSSAAVHWRTRKIKVSGIIAFLFGHNIPIFSAAKADSALAFLSNSALPRAPTSDGCRQLYGRPANSVEPGSHKSGQSGGRSWIQLSGLVVDYTDGLCSSAVGEPKFAKEAIGWCTGT